MRLVPLIAILSWFLGGILLGLIEVITLPSDPTYSTLLQFSSDFWEKPLINIGFIALLLGLVLGLAQYWSPVVFAGFILLLTGAMLYPIGRITEKFETPDNVAGETA